MHLPPALRTRSTFIAIASLLASSAGSCNLQKDVEIPQPSYDAQLVVECYLTPGQPYRLIVQQTTPFLAVPQPAPVTDAVAVITGPRGVDTLRFFPAVDTTGPDAQIFTHTSLRVFDGQPGETYSLLVYDGQGRRVTGTTVVQSHVPIDTVEVAFDPTAADTAAKASLLTRFTDLPAPGDAYRYRVVRESRGKLERQQSFEFPDDRFNGQPSGAGSTYRFAAGDTVSVRLYHIERAYWRFSESVQDAEGANGNPFAQPATIKSTVQGGLGVFTNLAWDERRLILKK